jgi:Spy/CpxP family protein refolding chaperone
MNPAMKWKLIAGFILVFLAGGATGVFLGASQTFRVFMGGHHAGFSAERMRSHLRWQLRLTDEQVAKISPVIDKAATQLEKIRTETGRRVRETFAETHREIAADLTPEQRAKLQEMEAQRRHGLHHARGPRGSTPDPEATSSPATAPQ